MECMISYDSCSYKQRHHMGFSRSGLYRWGNGAWLCIPLSELGFQAHSPVAKPFWNRDSSWYFPEVTTPIRKTGLHMLIVQWPCPPSPPFWSHPQSRWRVVTTLEVIRQAIGQLSSTVFHLFYIYIYTYTHTHMYTYILSIFTCICVYVCVYIYIRSGP